MALFQMLRKVPEVKGKLMSLVISLIGMVSDRQVMGFALYISCLTSLRVTSSKDDIFGRSFRKVKGLQD